MVHWIWLIVVALASGALGALIRAILASGTRSARARLDRVLSVAITEDVRAEKTSVEFEGNITEEITATCFAMPERLGLALSDLLTHFATALGHQSNYQTPKEARGSLKRVHRLNVLWR